MYLNLTVAIVLYISMSKSFHTYRKYIYQQSSLTSPWKGVLAITSPKGGGRSWEVQPRHYYQYWVHHHHHHRTSLLSIPLSFLWHSLNLILLSIIFMFSLSLTDTHFLFWLHLSFHSNLHFHTQTFTFNFNNIFTFD